MGSVPGSNKNNATGNGKNYQNYHPVYIALANTLSDPSWYMDSGASAYIMNNSAILNHTSQTYGKDEVTIGNG